MLRWRASLALVALLASAAPPAAAQRYLVRTYTESDGLPNNSVLDVNADASGCIWVLARTNLASYDGTVWESFSLRRWVRGPADFSRMAPDGSGGFWLVSRSVELRVARFDGQTFRPVPLDSSLPPSRWPVTAIASDGSTLAIGTLTSGLYVLRGTRWTHHPVGAGVHSLAAVGSLILVGTGDGFAVLKDGALRAPDGALEPLADVRGPVRALALEPGGRIWVHGEDWAGCLAGDALRRLDAPVPAAVAGSADTPLCIAPDGEGGLIAGNAAGLYRIRDGAPAPERLGSGSGLGDVGARAALRDREGNLWIASQKGVLKLANRPFASFDGATGLLADEVTSILSLSSGELLLAHPHGLSIASKGAFRHVAIPVPDPADPSYRILELVESGEDEVLVAGAALGLGRLSPTKGTLEWLPPARIGTLVWSLLKDRHGRILAGTPNGLRVLSGDRLLPQPGVAEMPIRRVTEGQDGTLYLSTIGQGLWFAPRGVPPFRRATGGEDEEAASIFGLLEGRDGTVEVGTAGGLYVLQGGALSRSADILIRRPVYLIQEDPTGARWYGTDYGVYRESRGALSHFTARDGLAGNEVNRTASAVDREGRLWIGTDRGATRIQPGSVAPASPPLRPEFLSVSAAGEVQPAGPRIRIPLGRGDLTFAVRAISFVDETRVDFRTRLEGLEAGWSDHTSATRLTLRHTIRSPGVYRLAVAARRQGGEWGPTVLSPEILVVRPLWQEGWLVVLGGLLLVGVAYLSARWRTERQAARRLEAEVSGRTAQLMASERRIAEEKDRLSVLLSSIADAVVATNAEGRILLANPAAAKLIGLQEWEALGRPVEEVLPLPGMPELIRSVLDSRQTAHPPAPFDVRLPGRVLRLDLTAAPLGQRDGPPAGVVFAFRDVSERIAAMEERVRAQKLEALGVMAGGLAHDFNNILSVVMGSVSMVRATGGLQEPSQARLLTAEKAVMRAKDLSRQLLTFAKGGSPVRLPGSVGRIVTESARLALSGSNVKANLDVATDLWSVAMDSGQITQVVSNLLINAREAMPEGGEIEISARNSEDPSRPREVVVVVRDRGVGIPPENLSRIFDPYFTTKVKGTGLGLAICYSIVKSHGGLLSVESSPGSGTTFTVRLPATEKVPAAPRERSDSGISVARGHGRVLVMDDDETIRAQLTDMLRYLGYVATTVSHGEEALRVWDAAEAAGKPFDVVLLDLTIPGGMGGKETFERLRERQPRIRAIASSGYAESPILTGWESHGFVGVLPKPYRVGDLARVLSSVLPARQEAS